MSEVEFERLLDAVRTAIEPAPKENVWAFSPDLDHLPPAANDNRGPWPLIPFPDGWYAVS